jgi:uncharacterized membrane protein YidH (DUF202 family)
VALDAAECPNCGEIFEAEALVAGTGEGAHREKFLFYVGVLLVILGGPGIALGSYLHDVLRIPVGGQAYDAFGYVNRFVTAIGLVVLIVGIVLLILSLRLASPEEGDWLEAGQGT